MAIYNLNGTQALSSYDIDANRLAQYYDIQGNPLLEYDVVVMTYNVGGFEGINSQQTMQDAIISKYEPTIIGMQELGSGSIPSVGENMLEDYGTKQLSSHNNKIMMVTDLTFSNYSTADFTNQDPKDAQLYGETRAYQKATVSVNGKSITWINAHLCFNTPSVKWQQMGEIFTMAEQETYCIITGDFNSRAMTESSDDYINMYKPFVDAGYNLANNSPNVGFHNTWTDSTSPTYPTSFTWACDSIIASSNIDIEGVEFDLTKLNYLNGSVVDHIPVVAYLKIN